MTIYRNIIDILSGKLIKDNVRTRDYLLEKAGFVNRLEERTEQVTVALDLIAELGGIDQEEARSRIDERMLDKKPRILVVDDEEAIRRVIKELLSTFVVMEAANGQEALAIAEKEHPNLVITDIKMPEMDGLNLLKNLKELYSELPVLATSGMVDAENIADHKFDGFISKPLKVEDLRKAVDELIAESKVE